MLPPTLNPVEEMTMTQENDTLTPETKEIDYKAAFSTQKGELDATKTKMTDLQNQLNSVLAHNEKVIGEQRAEKAKKVAAQDEKARAAGDHEQLLNSSEAKNKELQQQLSDITSKMSLEKVQTQSLKIAAELADGTNAELLSTFISRRLKETDTGIKVLDKDGQLTVSTVEDLKNEFLGSDMYKSLLRGIQSSGGGATGSGGSSSTSTQMKRSDWDKLDVAQQYKFISKDKGKLVD